MKPLKIFIALAAFASLSFTAHNEPRKITIVLDAGHGGNDYGVNHDGLTEKQLTARIVEKIKAENTNENIDIQITRTGDKNLTLQERADIINRVKPDLVLSIHINYNPNPNTSGFEIYTSKSSHDNNMKSGVFAKRLAEKLSQNLGSQNRGIKEAPFFILNKSESPAIIVELGFLSNANDRAMLTDERSQDNIARTILEFISEME